MNKLPLPDGSHLTAAEVQTLRVMLEGNKAQSAAEALGISARTVQGHLQSVYQKMNTHSLTQTLYRLQELGLLDYVRKAI